MDNQSEEDSRLTSLQVSSSSNDDSTNFQVIIRIFINLSKLQSISQQFSIKSNEPSIKFFIKTRPSTSTLSTSQPHITPAQLPIKISQEIHFTSGQEKNFSAFQPTTVIPSNVTNRLDHF
jgi:hypothetical protein